MDRDGHFVFVSRGDEYKPQHRWCYRDPVPSSRIGWLTHQVSMWCCSGPTSSVGGNWVPAAPGFIQFVFIPPRYKNEAPISTHGCYFLKKPFLAVALSYTYSSSTILYSGASLNNYLIKRQNCFTMKFLRSLLRSLYNVPMGKIRLTMIGSLLQEPIFC